MAINNFKPFATAANANVTAQADWETLPALLSGFMAGKASSAQVNKAIRQASFIAAALAQYTANKSGLDVLDDGDLNGFITKMSAAFGKDFQALDATLTALAGLATGANKLPYFTGNDTASQTDLTSVGRDIIGKNAIADVLTYLGIVSASLTTQGLVRLTSSRVSGAEDVAATANAVAQNYTDIKALQNKTNDATSTNKGIVKLSDNRNDQSSAASLIAASQKAASDNYYDIKTTFGQIGEKGRLIGVTYTNSQAMTIHVYVSGIASEGSVFLSATVNGINMNGSQCANIVGQRVCISFMVPAGGTYQVGISAGTLSSQAWVETDKK